MAAHQAPPFLGFSRQEHWSGLPFPSPMHESEKWKWSHSVVSMDCNLPGSSIHGIFQARVLEWGAIAFWINPREYQIVRIHRKETTWIQDLASPNHKYHPVQDTSAKQQTKQKNKPNHQQTGLPPLSALTFRGETNKQKTSAKISP